MPLLPAAGVPLRTPVELLNVTPLGSTPDSLSVGVGLPVAVTVNVPAAPTVNVVLFGLVISGAIELAGPKNTPLIAALAPAVHVTLIFTCPDTLQYKYAPPVKFVIVRASSSTLLFASTTVIVSPRPRMSQSNAYTAT